MTKWVAGAYGKVTFSATDKDKNFNRHDIIITFIETGAHELTLNLIHTNNIHFHFHTDPPSVGSMRSLEETCMMRLGDK